MRTARAVFVMTRSQFAAGGTLSESCYQVQGPCRPGAGAGNCDTRVARVAPVLLLSRRAAGSTLSCYQLRGLRRSRQGRGIALREWHRPFSSQRHLDKRLARH